ncbi:MULTISPECIES: long-chain fatty acid--CoA ligase [unclassified Acidiplasma]|nr:MULTISPECIES: long-chain fatty acid--CoA ligase [unclassified Acidiplasma]WMT55447.1 MAG: long-chain fatty acid--CoA ligase [Acidiplasma sp.]
MDTFNYRAQDDVLSKNYPPWVRRTIEIPVINIYSAFIESEKKYSKNAAVEFMGTLITYEDLKNEINNTADLLNSHGIKKGDRVAVMLPNVPQYVIVFFALMSLGAIIVQLNPLYTEREIIDELQDSESDTIITLDEFSGKILKFYPKKIKRIFFAGIGDYLPPIISWIYKLSRRNLTRVNFNENIIRLKRNKNLNSRETPRNNIDPENDPALFQYTGGTTGVPKAAVLTHYNLIANAYQIREWLPDEFKYNISFLSSIPFFHVYGMMTAMLSPLLSGSKIILIPDPRDIKMTLKIINKSKPTAFPGIPTLYHSIMNYRDVSKYNLRDIRVCISGAMPLPVELQKDFEKITGAVVVEGYGLSETSPVANINPIVSDNDITHRRMGSVGMPVPNTYEKIVSIDDGITEVPIGSPGELLIKGPQVMKGYWNRPDENNNVLSDGWLHTGDIAKMDNDGYVYILDRKKDMIIAGGYNIYPREIEEVLYQNPRISECAVIGIRDEHRGETVKAVIVRNDNTLTEDDVINFCRDKLAVYKVPKIIEFRDELPKTLVGKIDKKLLVNENLDRIIPK